MSQFAPLETLFLPLQDGPMAPEGKTLFIGARYHPALADLTPKPDMWQVFKPFSDELASQGFAAAPDFPAGRDYAAIFILLPKQAEEAKFWLAMACTRLKPGGRLFAAAANDAGGNRIGKWFAEAGLDEIGSESKHRARVVWGVKSGADETPQIKAWQEAGLTRQEKMADGEFYLTQPGLFSWDRIDPASRLMIGHFPKALSGHVADFGAGWGYLSRQILLSAPKVTGLTMIEADSRALGCAIENIRDVQGGRAINPLWHDLRQPLASHDLFDYVIMNPPFHTGKKNDIALGQAFILQGARSLKKGGSLTLVANIHLPYESVLEGVLKNTKLVAQENGFKILRAVR